MRIKVVDGPVRQNIELFQRVLRHHPHPRHSTKLFKAWINRKTGQFFVDDIHEESSFLGKKDWKPVDIVCVYDPQLGEMCFLVEESELSKKSFRYDDLTPAAYAIMSQTLLLLNKISEQLKGPSDLETKMGVILKLELENAEPTKIRNILLEAWHPSDRYQAEVLLWDKPAGTFLFRKDPYADLLEIQLERHHGKKVKCFTLTYSQSDRMFSDLTLVHYEGYWLIYDDDPALQEPRFSELMELLDQLRHLLKYPLYH